MRYLIINIIIVVLMTGCSNTRKIKFTDFPRIHTDIIVPVNGKGYTTAGYEVKDNTNDTIIIRFHQIERKYSGEFQEKVYFDYYGGMGLNFEFDSYKAVSGSVFVQYGIY